MGWDQKRIRRTFLDYFVERGHREVPSSPLIPQDDPTLLFTNAGMNQFKSLLLGDEVRDYTRACSVQKCIRAGGKHNDLDAVGKDARHLTFFEMLGNWSFGDYYKRETIKMAWDLSVNVFGLDADRIHISVYRTDEASYSIWRDEIGVPEARIYRFGHIEEGDDENFWSMGDTGPCGPCTELFFDLGPEAGTGPEDFMGGEGDRYMEFWNNVFMESNRRSDGTFESLKLQSVDTGMGMERITMLLQNKMTVYQTDLFQPLIGRIAELSGTNQADPERLIDMQVIADHLRSLTFANIDGGQFSNEGRGYVLRRILRRAVRHGRRLGFKQPFLCELAPFVAEQFEGIHTLPAQLLANTAETLRDEEERFFRTIDRGMKRIQIIMGKAQDTQTISGKDAFELYDTFGFPVDLTQIEAEEHDFKVDVVGFEVEMEEARNRSRKHVDKSGGTEWTVLTEGGGDGFAGYGLSELESPVMRWRYEQEQVELVLRQTPFYAESGGETADHGVIHGDGFRIDVTDVRKINGIIHHIGRVVEGTVALATDSVIRAVVDTDRRSQKTIHHTATHLLHAALRAIVGTHVVQKGSVVEPNRLRFDFSHGKALTDEQVQGVEAWVNTRIRQNETVKIIEGVPLETAREQGVVALFGEKYGEVVRTVRAGSDSFELCGGNHVGRTGDIGHLVVTGQSPVSAGVRRIEAVVGHAADALGRAEREMLRAVSRSLKIAVPRLPERVEALQAEVRELKKALEKARRSGGAVDADALIAGGITVGEGILVSAKVEVDSRETLAALVDRIRDKRPDSVVVLGAVLDDKVAVIAAVGPRLKKGPFHAGKIIKAVTALVDGRGGGRPDFAQGGGQALEKLADAMASVPTIVGQQIGS